MAGALGLRKPTDTRHLSRYGITAETLPTIPTGVPIGINWYLNFDDPQPDSQGHYWVGRGDLGTVRGGHCVCLRAPKLIDRWWPFYDQGNEGACCGFGVCRALSLQNRKRYDGSKLYHAAQLIDDWSDTPPESGTSVRAACDVARLQGAWCVVRGKSEPNPDPEEGILQNRWALSIEDIAYALDPDSQGTLILNRGWVGLLNSWGAGYEREVRMPLDTLYRMIVKEDGEAMVMTDRPAPPNN